MEKTIFNFCVKVKSVVQIQRLIEECKKVNVKSDLMPFNKKSDYFRVSYYDKKTFSNWLGNYTKLKEVTEAEFLQLLKEYKDGK